MPVFTFKFLMLFYRCRLYWVSDSNEIMFCTLSDLRVSKLPLPGNATPTAIAIYNKELYYSDDSDQSIYVTDALNGANASLKALRNNTSGVVSLRIYDAKDQVINPNDVCVVDNGDCQHLCVPYFDPKDICRCAIGYYCCNLLSYTV